MNALPTFGPATKRVEAAGRSCDARPGRDEQYTLAEITGSLCARTIALHRACRPPDARTGHIIYALAGAEPLRDAGRCNGRAPNRLYCMHRFFTYPPPPFPHAEGSAAAGVDKREYMDLHTLVARCTAGMRRSRSAVAAAVNGTLAPAAGGERPPGADSAPAHELLDHPLCRLVVAPSPILHQQGLLRLLRNSHVLHAALGRPTGASRNGTEQNRTHSCSVQ